jgi:hypothetical protein
MRVHGFEAVLRHIQADHLLSFFLKMKGDQQWQPQNLVGRHWLGQQDSQWEGYRSGRIESCFRLKRKLVVDLLTVLEKADSVAVHMTVGCESWSDCGQLLATASRQP